MTRETRRNSFSQIRLPSESVQLGIGHREEASETVMPQGTLGLIVIEDLGI